MRLFTAGLFFWALISNAAEVEPNNTIAQANVLTLDSTGTASVLGKISATGDIDYFRIKTPLLSSPGTLTVTMMPTSSDYELDAKLQLLDSNGKLLASRDSGSDNVTETLSYTELSPNRTYFVACSSVDLLFLGAGNYALQVKFAAAPGIFGFIQKPSGPGTYPVSLLTFGGAPKFIDPKIRTWIVIHGWNSSRVADNINAAAAALFQSRPGEQILTLDWSSAADTGILEPISAEDGIVPVAKWAAAALLECGFSGTNLNLVGHSYGSYVADEIAQRIPGGVDTMVTLDPGADVSGEFSFLNTIDFERDSNFSWSFHASSLGNDIIPATADEAFIVDSGLLPSTAHSAVLWLFAYMILHPENPVAGYFMINSLLTDAIGPWLPNQYTSDFFGDNAVKGYEAIIESTDGGEVPASIDFVPLPSLSIRAVSEGIVVSWPKTDLLSSPMANYSAFVLEASTNLGKSASWISITNSPSIVGSSNAFIFDGTGHWFFRLKQNE